MSTPDGAVEFDHHAPSFVTENAPIYETLRKESPVAYTMAHGGYWVLSKYDTVFNVARDDDSFSSAREVVIPASDVGRLIPLQSDPPDLTRYRGILSPHFTPRALAPIREFVNARVDECLDAIADKGSAEIVRELANPVPSSTTMRLLGLDPSDWRTFADPLHASSYTQPGTPENAAARQAVNAFTSRIEDEIDDRIEASRDDMISEILATAWGGEKTSRQEAIDLVRMVIFGGMDTVMAAISNMFVRLGRDQRLQKELREDPSLIPGAIEEFLRLDAPVQGFARTVTADVVLGGQKIEAGESVFMLWASANRDEDAFGSDAAEVNIRRTPNRHMTFGIGGHRCMGSTLARMELRTVAEKALHRLDEIRLDEEHVALPATVGIVYGHREVPVSYVKAVQA